MDSEQIQSAHLRKYVTKDQGFEASKFPSRHFPILMDSQPLDYRVRYYFVNEYLNSEANIGNPNQFYHKK